MPGVHNQSGVSYAVLYKVVVRRERNGSELTLASDQLTTEEAGAPPYVPPACFYALSGGT